VFEQIVGLSGGPRVNHIGY